MGKQSRTRRLIILLVIMNFLLSYIYGESDDPCDINVINK